MFQFVKSQIEVTFWPAVKPYYCKTVAGVYHVRPCVGRVGVDPATEVTKTVLEASAPEPAPGKVRAGVCHGGGGGDRAGWQCLHHLSLTPVSWDVSRKPMTPLLTSWHLT